jgi:hypothetical protein
MGPNVSEPTPEPAGGHGCDGWADELAAMAVGTLSGRDRDRLLDHLDACPRCAAEVEELSAVADSLLALVPEATPPEGFAARTTAAIRAEHRRTRSRRPSLRRALVAACVAAALAVGVGIGAIASSSGHGGPPAIVHTAALVSTSGVQGTAVVSSAKGGLLVMTVDHGPASGPVTCTVSLAGGGRRVVGTYSLSHGYGWWTGHLPVPVSEVRAVNLYDSRGAWIASARIPA